MSLLGYYARLALRSFRRNTGLTALMVFAIALGIAVCVMTLTVYHAMAGNPIWWKSDRLYTVTLDSWDPNRPADESLPHLPPPQLTYRDATALFASTIPQRKVIMHKADGVISGGANTRGPLSVTTRVTTADFFPIFDVPFQYGGGWDAEADRGPAPVIVLSHDLNETLFGGINSVGSTVRWNDLEFRIVGVLDEWMPMPKFYDLNSPRFDPPEDVYIPWEWNAALELFSTGNILCWKFEQLDTFDAFRGSECVWIQMWVELPNAEALNRMQALLDAYWSEQRNTGRFQRPQNNRLTPVDQWLKDREVVDDDNRVLVALSFAFLAVCLINTVGLLLAKFLNAAPVSGIRRALGASRRQIFAQHLVEVGVLAAVGATLGLAIGAAGLWGVRVLYSSSMVSGSGGYQELAQLSGASVGWAVALAVIAALSAGLYPAYRVGRLAPSVYLKSQ